MLIGFEIAGPCRLIPRYEHNATMRRVMWLWFGVFFMPYDFNEIFMASAMAMYDNPGWAERMRREYMDRINGKGE